MKNRLSIDAKGIQALRTSLRDELRRMSDAVSAALYDEALKIDARALEEDMAPWDTGRLKQSHYVAPPTVDAAGERITVDLGYGVAYAIYVHERTELHHPHGQAKWLQRTLEQFAQGFEQRIAAKVKRARELNLTFRAIPATAPTSPQQPRLRVLPPPKEGSGG